MEEVARLAEQKQFDYIVIESTGISEPMVGHDFANAITLISMIMDVSFLFMVASCGDVYVGIFGRSYGRGR